MRSTTAVVTGAPWLVTAALLLSASLAEAQPGSAAPSGDVYSSSTNCQTVHQQAVGQINAQHSQEWPACRGASECIRTANAKKADALKREGEKLRICQASRTSEPPPLRPLPVPTVPTVAPGFKPGRPGTWKTQNVTWKGEKWAVYTDPKGQPWRFPTQYIESDNPNRKDLGNTWILERNTINPNGTYLGRKMPTAKYRKLEYMSNRPTDAYAEKAGAEVENFPYAR